MTQQRQKVQRKFCFTDLWFYGSLFFLYSLYIWHRIGPNLYFMYQQPAFYFTPQFFSTYLDHPGGLLEAFGALLSQFCLIPPLGAAVLSIILLGTALTTRVWMSTIGGGKSAYFISFVPVILLFMLYHEYGHPLAGFAGLLAALVAFTIFSRIYKSRPFLSWILLFMSFPFFYTLCGGPVFFFALLCILYILSNDSQSWVLRAWMTLSLLIVAVLSVHLPIRHLMIAPLRDKIGVNLLMFSPSRLLWVSWLLYGFYPLAFLLIRIPRVPALSKRLPKLRSLSFPPPFQFTGIVILSGLATIYSFDMESKANLSVEFKSHEQRWQEVLDRVQDQPILNLSTSVQSNRALYHTGQLLDSMFAYPQEWGVHGLFYPQEYGYVYPLQISDLFYDLAHITESQHWAYEAQVAHPDSPWNLRRLIQTHILKGDLPAAKRYLHTAEHSPFFKGWTDVHRLQVEHPARIMQDSALREKFNLMPKTDFISHSAIPRDDLKALLGSNPDNRMAFEYLMSLGLLSKQLDLISEYAKSLSRFHYAHIPAHLEEAYLIYLTSDPSHNLAISGYQIRQGTAERFKDYLRIADMLRSDPKRMQEALRQKHGDTYWFYFYFHQQRDLEALSIPAMGLPGKKK